MSNQYNPKRSWSEKENSNSKKNKMPEKEFNISIQTIELIESSDDELNNSGEIGELQQTKESSHYRKNINKISLKKIYPGLCNLMSLQTENNISNKISTLKPASLEKPSKSKSKYGSYKNSIAGFDFLDSIASVIKNSLFDELNSSPYWSVMIDEANSVDDDKYLAIVGKCIANNMPIMRYLVLINLYYTV